MGTSRNPALFTPTKTKRERIVVGASTGGVEALQRFFAALPATFPAVVGAVLHRGSSPTSRLASVLARGAALPVREPHDGETLQRGTIYLAPADHHMVFHDGYVSVLHDPKESYARPSIDRLFRSAAIAYGERVVGVLLSGAGTDGVRGMRAIIAAGGLCLVQDPHEAAMPSLLLNVLRNAHVDGIFLIDDLASMLEVLVRGKQTVRARKPMIDGHMPANERGIE